ncbi:MAG TPA: RNA polymerase sigma factor [Bacteroidales bacterium]|nr:RNA polymerase sigma factor [Bacteroidales bacterium]
MVKAEHSLNISKTERDYRLVKQILESGNRSAYAQLMDEYFEKVYARMLKMTGQSSDAEDLTMEAFNKAFSKLDQYTPDFAFSTWLYRIAKNNCIDYLRRNKKENENILNQQEAGNGMVAHELANQLPSPEQLMINRQETRLLREIVDTLHPKYKDIVIDHYFNELSCEEIANKLNLPEGTVKVRLFRARELLYNIMSKS